ncbi:MAG TPA: hypothetical protein DDX19_05270 [Rhodopirellula baltica]|nr:hypothetical protein [Rhodopirellula baltica]
MQFFLAKDGSKEGPLTSKDLRKLSAEGKLKPDDLIFIDNQSKPVRARRFSGLFTNVATNTKQLKKGSRRFNITKRSVFISCVTHEFRHYRDLLAARLSLPGVEVRHQESFIDSGTTTLGKLKEYISTCDAVIHVIGDSTGSYPTAAEVGKLRSELDKFGSTFDLSELEKPPGISYTQWEAWLAIYYDKPVLIYKAADLASRSPEFAFNQEQKERQRIHWRLLEANGRDRREFASAEELVIEVLRSLLIVVPDIKQNVGQGDFRDRNLLFGVLALQDALISREAFVRACGLWAMDTGQSLSELLESEGIINRSDRVLVEARLERKILAKGGDPRKSLADAIDNDIRLTLSESLDPQTIASLPDQSHFLKTQLSPEHWRYRLTRTHQTGGLGVVSVAEDTVLNRNVAIKQLKGNRAIDPMAIERFLREARITGRLQHPNIIPVYELGLTPDDQLPFYAMRFVGHKTLHDAIRHHHLDRTASERAKKVHFRELLQSFVSVCKAVAYAHSEGIMHRDIKPANIMLGDYGEVILLDWGLAKRIGDEEPDQSQKRDVEGKSDDSGFDQTRAGTRLGSPGYMAPEQASGRISDHGAHTDIYGLGATLYELIAGDLPFKASSTASLMEAIQHQSIPSIAESNKQVPAALVAICGKAMEKLPADRYASAEALADDIQNWLADEPIAVLPDNLLRASQRAIRKRPSWVSGTIAALAVGVLTVTTGLFFVNKEKNLKNESLTRESELRRVAVANESRATKSLELAETRLETIVGQRTEIDLATAQTYLATSQELYANGQFDHAARLLLPAFRLSEASNKLKQAVSDTAAFQFTHGGKQAVPLARFKSPILQVSSSQDGTKIAVLQDNSRIVFVIDPKSMTVNGSFECESVVQRVLMNAAGTHLLIAVEDGKVLYQALSDPKDRTALLDTPSDCTQLQFGARDSIAYVGTLDGLLKYDLRSGRLLARCKTEFRCDAIVPSKDGNVLYISGRQDRIDWGGLKLVGTIKGNGLSLQANLAAKRGFYLERVDAERFIVEKTMINDGALSWPLATDTTGDLILYLQPAENRMVLNIADVAHPPIELMQLGDPLFVNPSFPPVAIGTYEDFIVNYVGNTVSISNWRDNRDSVSFPTNSQVRSVCWASAGRIIVSGHEDGTVRVHHPFSNAYEEAVVERTVTNPAIDSGQRYLACLNSDKKLGLLDLRSYEWVTQDLCTTTGLVQSLKFNSDSEWIMVDDESGLFVVNCRDGKRKVELGNSKSASEFSADGTLVVTKADERVVELYDLQQMHSIDTVGLDLNSVLDTVRCDMDTLRYLLLSSEGKTQQLRVIDVSDGRIINEISIKTSISGKGIYGRFIEKGHVSVVSDRNLFCDLSSENRVLVEGVPTPDFRHALALQLNPNSDTIEIQCRSVDDTDSLTSRPLKRAIDQFVIVSPKSDRVLVCSDNGQTKTLEVFTVGSLSLIDERFCDSMDEVEWTDDGENIWIRGDDGLLSIWNPSSKTFRSYDFGDCKHSFMLTAGKKFISVKTDSIRIFDVDWLKLTNVTQFDAWSGVHVDELMNVQLLDGPWQSNSRLPSVKGVFVSIDPDSLESAVAATTAKLMWELGDRNFDISLMTQAAQLKDRSHAGGGSDSWRWWGTIANRLFEEQRYADSLDASLNVLVSLGKEKEESDNYVVTLANIAKCQSKLGEFQKARTCLTNALAARDSIGWTDLRVQLLFELATIDADAGQPEEFFENAEAFLEKTAPRKLELWSSYSTLSIRLAREYRLKGRHDKAVVVVGKILDDVKSGAGGLSDKKLLEILLCLHAGKDFANLIDVYQSFSYQPDSSEQIFYLGVGEILYAHAKILEGDGKDAFRITASAIKRMLSGTRNQEVLSQVEMQLVKNAIEFISKQSYENRKLRAISDALELY